MFPFSHSKNKIKKGIGPAETLSLVIDIESGLTRAALVIYVSGMPPRVLYTVSSPIVNRASSTALVAAMSKSLKEVTAVLATKGLPDIRARGIELPISKIHCALSSPWIVSKTKTVKMDFGKEADISKDTVKKIIDGERAEMEKNFTDMPGHDLVIIEQKIFEIKLNGYPMTRIQGRRAREIELSFAVTASSAGILERIRETIAGNFGHAGQGAKGGRAAPAGRAPATRAEEFHSSLLLQYAAFRNLVKVRNDYIAAHVHNDLSDIIVVRRGVCSILASFPFGFSAFVEKSSQALNQSKPVAHSALSLRSAQKLTPDSEKTVADASDPIIREWAAQFFKTLAAVDHPEGLPTMLVLSVQDHFPYFQKALKNEEQGARLDITPLDEAILEKAVVYDRGQDANALVTMYAFALNPDMHADIGLNSI